VNGRCTIAGDALEDQCTTTANAFEGSLHNYGAFPRGMIRLFLLGVENEYSVRKGCLRPFVEIDRTSNSSFTTNFL